jgi:hypothetical protein
MRGLENFSVEVYRSRPIYSERDKSMMICRHPVGEMAAMGVWSVDYIF